MRCRRKSDLGLSKRAYNPVLASRVNWKVCTRRTEGSPLFLEELENKELA